MAKIIRKHGIKVRAWRLGSNLELEQIDGLIVDKKSYYILHSQYCKGMGEIAQYGDYFLLSKSGFPYAKKQAWFEDNHRHIRGCIYEQIPKPLDSWEVTDLESKPLDFLIENGRFKIQGNLLMAQNSNDDTWIITDRNGVVVFHNVIQDATGNIVDVDFTLMNRAEFEKNYRYW